uniref:Uncharacterized protein n=1 Tax=Panagrolaimus sp. JU765 TaxID=591449 RepID=A0AC34QK25_9BILA
MAPPSSKKNSRLVSFGILRKNPNHEFHLSQYCGDSPSSPCFSATTAGNSTINPGPIGPGSITTSTGSGQINENHSSIPSSSSTGHFHHHLGVNIGHARRESFLYKADDRDLLATSSCRPVSRASSVASTDPP